MIEKILTDLGLTRSPRPGAARARRGATEANLPALADSGHITTPAAQPGGSRRQHCAAGWRDAGKRRDDDGQRTSEHQPEEALDAARGNRPRDCRPFESHGRSQR